MRGHTPVDGTLGGICGNGQIRVDCPLESGCGGENATRPAVRFPGKPAWIAIWGRFLVLAILAICPQIMAQSEGPGAPGPSGGPVRSGVTGPVSAILTEQEREWLRQHDGQIRIGVTILPPQILQGEEGYKGLSIDYIHLLERRLGCRFQLVPLPTWNDVILAARARQIDMIFAAQQTPERLSFLDFTRPYLELPNMIVTRKDKSGGDSLKDMKGWRVAVVQGSAVHERLKAECGFLDLRPVPDELSGLMRVSMGEVDAMVVEISRASYYIEKAEIVNLRIAGSANLVYMLRFATRKDWPVLCGILDKGLASISDDERSAIHRKWILAGDGGLLVGRGLWIGLGVMLVLVLLGVVGVIFWNRNLHRIVRLRTGQLQEELAERRRVEDEIRELNVTLEQRVDERTRELAEARDRAEAADRMKSAFLATMSHELRTPLNSIIGFTGVVLMELAGPLTDEQRKQLEMVRSSAQHLLAIVCDVLDISRIEAGQMVVNPEPFDLRACIEKTVGAVRPQAEKKGIAVHVDVGLEEVTLTSDPRRVEQVLLNVLGNAVKFTERGDVFLKAETVPGWVRVSVADTGIGIRPEDLDRLFLPFSQVDTGLARQHDGTGLGLAICRRLLDKLGGEIHVESVFGQGSVFVFTLPLAETEES